MDAIIGRSIIDSIQTKLKDVMSYPTPDQYEKSIEMLFDGEVALQDASDRLIEDSFNQIGNAVQQGNPDQIRMIAIKTVHRALLLGFLSERFVRDQLMDKEGPKLGSSIRRDYETIEQFMKRKLSQIDLKSIAVNESKRNQW